MSDTSRSSDAYTRATERLIVIAGEVPGPASSLTTALEKRGYAVRWAATGRGMLDQLSTLNASAIVISSELPDMTGVEACQHLTDLGLSTLVPVLLVPTTPLSQETRLGALQAGAWECFNAPPDFDELLLKLDRWINAGQEAQRARAEALVDPTTGLYNHVGLARRARELGSLGSRQHASLACIALSLEAADPAGTEAPGGAGVRCGRLLGALGRRSDAIGRLGPREFVVLAPATDAAGAMRLAHRLVRGLMSALAQGEPTGARLAVRAGFEAVPNLGFAPVEPVELLAHATTALRTGRIEGGFGWMRQVPAHGDLF